MSSDRVQQLRDGFHDGVLVSVVLGFVYLGGVTFVWLLGVAL